MIDRLANIDTVQKVANPCRNSVVGPITGLTKEGEKAFGRCDVATGARTYAIEELTVLCYPTPEGRFTSVLAGRPDFGQVQQAFQQRHRHLQ